MSNLFWLPLLMIASFGRADSLPSFPEAALHGKMLAPGLYQLTGTHLLPGQTVHDEIQEVADPAPPYLTETGKVEIYGTGHFALQYRNWDDFSHAGPYQMISVPTRYPDGHTFKGVYTHVWDIRKFRLEYAHAPSREIIVGGSMSPTHGRPEAVWPEDNINRRVFMFRQNAAAEWIRDLFPVVGDINSGWVGHSYGGNFYQEGSPDLNVLRPDDPTPIYFFYEKVNEATAEAPLKTELFVKSVSISNGGDRIHFSSEETKILGVGDPPLPSTVRTIGGYLIEGPRPIKIRIGGQDFFIIGFSSGDYPTDRYAINYAWSKSVTGPYHPAMTADGRDLLDLGLPIKAKYGLSWLGRPVFYRTPEGRYEMMFHAVFKDILPDNDYAHWPVKYGMWAFFRAILKTELDLRLDASGSPRIRILTRGRQSVP